MAKRLQNLSFISRDPKVGDPDIAWDDFKSPKLRQFSGDFILEHYIGGGMDGIVIKAREKCRNRYVAIKVFHFNHQPPPINMTPAFSMSNHMDPHNPLIKRQCRVPAFEGAPRYWAFKRECLNTALLEKLETSLRLAKDSGQDILVNLQPATAYDALQNLKSFSIEGRDENCRTDNLKPFSPNVQLTPCYGWTQLSGAAIKAYAPIPTEFLDEEQYFAIVYDFIPEGHLELENIINQLNFFHITGFLNVSLNCENWLSTGVLVDFSDIVPLHTGYKWWRESEYKDGISDRSNGGYVAESIRRVNEHRARTDRAGSRDFYCKGY